MAFRFGGDLLKKVESNSPGSCDEVSGSLMCVVDRVVLGLNFLGSIGIACSEIEYEMEVEFVA